MFKLRIENITERGILCHYCNAVNLFNFGFCTSSQLRTECVQIQDETTQDGAAISRSVGIYLILFFSEFNVCANKVMLSKVTPWPMSSPFS